MQFITVTSRELTKRFINISTIVSIEEADYEVEGKKPCYISLLNQKCYFCYETVEEILERISDVEKPLSVNINPYKRIT